MGHFPLLYRCSNISYTFRICSLSENMAIVFKFHSLQLFLSYVINQIKFKSQRYYAMANIILFYMIALYSAHGFDYSKKQACEFTFVGEE